jgi:hypothetical protein
VCSVADSKQGTMSARHEHYQSALCSRCTQSSPDLSLLCILNLSNFSPWSLLTGVSTHYLTRFHYTDANTFLLQTSSKDAGLHGTEGKVLLWTHVRKKGSRCLAPLSLNLGARRRYAVKLRLLYPCVRTPVSGVEAGWTPNLDVLERRKTARPGFGLLSVQYAA